MGLDGIHHQGEEVMRELVKNLLTTLNHLVDISSPGYLEKFQRTGNLQV